MITLKNITKTYNQGRANEFLALKNVDFSVNDGELVGIIGRSGAGKSTLLHILSCIDGYESGEYSIDGMLVKDRSEKELAQIRNTKIGVIMQDYALIEDFTCIENVMLPLDFAVHKRKNKKALALEALGAVGMESMADKTVNKLSGGQKQRIAIARAIVNEPSIILADEPTGALDSQTSKDIMELFKELNNKGKTIIIVTHDMEIAKQCDRIIKIADGAIIDYCLPN